MSKKDNKMTKAFLEPTIITKENVDLFLKALSPEAIEKVKKIDKERKKRRDELFKNVNCNPTKEELDEIMKAYE
jgi:hypothetical protein